MALKISISRVTAFLWKLEVPSISFMPAIQNCLVQTLHPGRLTWNIIMEVWKMIFLSKWVICRFHVNLPGCITQKGPDKNHHDCSKFPSKILGDVLSKTPFFQRYMAVYLNCSWSNFCFTRSDHTERNFTKSVNRFFLKRRRKDGNFHSSEYHKYLEP